MVIRTKIGQTPPTRIAKPTLKAMARPSRFIQTPRARPMLVIRAPWARIVAIDQEDGKKVDAQRDVM